VFFIVLPFYPSLISAGRSGAYPRKAPYVTPLKGEISRLKAVVGFQFHIKLVGLTEKNSFSVFIKWTSLNLKSDV
jgi:hypothetical protein